MAVQFKNYYEILGVPQSADFDRIKKAFRAQAKRSHPDNNPDDPKLEDEFKLINEAYEVLSNAERRKQYDDLGKDWTSPPSSEQTGPGSRYSEFFARVFGTANDATPPRDARRANERARKIRSSRKSAIKPYLESEMTITLEEALRGASRRVTLAIRETDALQRTRTRKRHFQVKIPAGIQDGQQIRLKGQGKSRGKQREDVLIRILIGAHPIYAFDGDDLVTDLRISPWEAALGERVEAHTLEGPIQIKLPKGVGSGKKVRLRGKGYPRGKGKGRGDMLYRILIVVPESLTREEHALFWKLGDISRFDPRRKT